MKKHIGKRLVLKDGVSRAHRIIDNMSGGTPEELNELKQQGDSGTIGEELLQGVDPLEEKCRVVRQVVRDGDMNILQALEAYGVTKEQYTNYLKKIYGAK